MATISGHSSSLRPQLLEAISKQNVDLVLSLLGHLDPKLAETIYIHGLDNLLTRWRQFPELVTTKFSAFILAFLIDEPNLAAKHLLALPEELRSSYIDRLESCYPDAHEFIQQTQVHLASLQEIEKTRLTAHIAFKAEKKRLKLLISRRDVRLTDEDDFYKLAQKVKNDLKEDHYVFTHGQSTEASILTLFIHKLIKKRFPTLYHPLNPPFRFPGLTLETGNAATFCKAKRDQINDNELNTRCGDLLSVDALLSNDEDGESALSFATINRNMVLRDSHFKHSVVQILSQLPRISPEERSRIAEELYKITEEKNTRTSTGTLCVIAIPKELIQNEESNFTYAAHPFGTPCGRRSVCPQDRIRILEQLQEGKPITCYANSGIPECASTIQYRILAAKMAQEPRVRVVPIDGASPSTHKLFKQKIKDLIAKLPS